MTDLQTAFDAFITPYHGDVLFDEPLAAHCSFKIGGPAEIFFTPYNEEALLAALRYAKENGVRLHILGNGSNVLISEKGLGGITVRLMGGLTALEKRADGSVFCGAGVSLKRLCTFALENGLTGLEFAYGIPGSVGGAVYMNAGAYGGEIKNVLQKVRCIDPATLETKEYEASSLDISYRSTPFMKNKEIITGAVFSLSAGDPAVSSAVSSVGSSLLPTVSVSVSEEVGKIRLSMGNSGSVGSVPAVVKPKRSARR